MAIFPRLFVCSLVACFALVGLLDAEPPSWASLAATQPSSIVPSAESVAKSTQLIKIMGVEKMMIEGGSSQEAIDRSGTFLMAKILHANAGKEEQVRKIVTKVRREILPRVVPDFIGYEISLYAASFSPQELDELISFYQSDKMQKILKMAYDLSTNPKAPQPSPEDLRYANSLFTTQSGEKLEGRMITITQRLNLYAVDVVRKKDRDLMYSSLRKELPANGLIVPNPFEPDTMVDQALHDRVAMQNAQIRTLSNPSGIK